MCRGINVADDEDYEPDEGDYEDFDWESRDEVYGDDEKDEDTPWYFKASTLPFGILAVILAYGWLMLVWVNHLPSYLDEFAVPLFFLGWMGVPLILGWWHER